jgi:hypothetical protein
MVFVISPINAALDWLNKAYKGIHYAQFIQKGLKNALRTQTWEQVRGTRNKEAR